MIDLRVRPARPDELQAVGKLTVEAYRVDGYLGQDAVDGYANELGDAEGRAQHTELLVAVDRDDQLLGTVAVVTPGSEYAEISRDGELELRMLAVSPSARRRGVGEALVRVVIDRARTLGARRVVLCTWDRMTSVRRFYERLGFRRAPDRDWRPREDVFLMGYCLDMLHH